jgi:hypothetical protein
MRRWEAKVVAARDVDKYLEDGWEPVSLVEVNPMAGGPTLMWGIRRMVVENILVEVDEEQVVYAALEEDSA